MRQLLKLTKKSIALIMCILMVLPLMLTNAFAAELIDETLLFADRFITDEKYYVVTKGITEKFVVLNNAASDNQIKNYILEVDLSNPDLSIIAGYNQCDGNPADFGMLTLPEQAEAAEKNRGVNVIAAVNGAGYNTRTGEPTGILIMDGKEVHAAGKHSFFAILNDGTAVIRKAGERTDDVKEAIPGMIHTVDNGKAYYNYDPTVHPRTAVGIKADGTVVFMVSDGRQSPDSCGMSIDEQTDTMIALGCVDVLSLDGGGSSTFMAQREALSDFSVRNSPCYGFNRPIATSLMICTKATATGEFDHITFGETKYLAHPEESIIIRNIACDENGFEVKLPGGRLVVEDESYGTMKGPIFTATAKEGTVNVNYVTYDGQILGSVPVVISEENDDYTQKTANAIIKVIGNMLEMIEFVIKKLKSFFG